MPTSASLVGSVTVPAVPAVPAAVAVAVVVSIVAPADESPSPADGPASLSRSFPALAFAAAPAAASPASPLDPI